MISFKSPYARVASTLTSAQRLNLWLASSTDIAAIIDHVSRATLSVSAILELNPTATKNKRQT